MRQKGGALASVPGAHAVHNGPATPARRALAKRGPGRQKKRNVSATLTIANSVADNWCMNPRNSLEGPEHLGQMRDGKEGRPSW